MSSLFSSNAANWTPMPPCGCGCQYYRAVKMEWHAHPMGVFVTDTEDTVHHAVAVFFVCGKCDKENRSTYTITSDGKESRPCPPLSSPDDDLTVHIGDRQVTVSANWLMVVSPVVKRMLSVEMKEKQQRTLNLDGHDITMEQFMQFLETVNDHLQYGRTLPNPTNVLYLLELADYFQIDWLKTRCETHLINCVEIPLIERFLLIEPYRLSNLKYLKRKCPNLKFLSLSGNPGWPHPILNDNLQLYRTYACWRSWGAGSSRAHQVFARKTVRLQRNAKRQMSN
ncbi:hypothetical protein GPALN_002292 [Globodera pallida]|nr:hypothetical protein GPALN_002292 [Globodera pallida]